MSTSNKLDPGDLAEQAGHHTFYTALLAMRRENSQGARLGILEDALLDLFSTAVGSERAFKGFAVGLLVVIDAALKVKQ
ncbi:MAG: hypothetical protein K9K38_21705 [Rhodoferax sp.]|nr:hypothetical protein [Rhodoferax sp.]